MACVVISATESHVFQKTLAAAARQTQHACVPCSWRGQLAPAVGDGRVPVRFVRPRSAAALVLSGVASRGGLMLHSACRLPGLICWTATVSITSIADPAGDAASLQSRSDAAAPPKLTQAR